MVGCLGNSPPTHTHTHPTPPLPVACHAPPIPSTAPRPFSNKRFFMPRSVVKRTAPLNRRQPFNSLLPGLGLAHVRGKASFEPPRTGGAIFPKTCCAGEAPPGKTTAPVARVAIWFRRERGVGGGGVHKPKRSSCLVIQGHNGKEEGQFPKPKGRNTKDERFGGR